MNGPIKGVLATDAGMLALWDPQSFQSITDYDTWEAQLLEDEDILRHIASGAYVPVNIHSDGAFGYELRAGSLETPTALTSREQTYQVVSSQPYRFRSQGEVCISGIEHVEGEPSDLVGRLSLPSGEYAAVVYLLAWDEEPGMKTETGSPTDDALPDFLILLDPVTDSRPEFRTKIDTFDPPTE